jgi:hypothetical protein
MIDTRYLRETDSIYMAALQEALQYRYGYTQGTTDALMELFYFFRYREQERLLQEKED